MFVRTERLFLRPGWPEDLDELVRALSDPMVQCDVGPVPLSGSVADVRAYLERRRDPRLPHFFMYLRAPKGAELVGGVGLGRDEGEVEVAYWIAAPFRGCGFAREGLRAVLDQARSLGYRRIMATDFGNEPATHQVLSSVGFEDTGRVRSRYCRQRRMERAARIYFADLVRQPSQPAMQAGILTA